MANKQDLCTLFRDCAEARKNWGWFLSLGILLIIFGALLISCTFTATMLSVVAFGLFLAAAGIVQIVQAFMVKKWGGLFLSLLMGILYLVTGVICITRPEEAAVSLTLLIGVFCFVGGLARMLTPLIMHFEHWGWVFFNGLVTFILGIMILAQWPYTGLWVIGLFVAIDMILSGWSWVLLSLAVRPKS